VPRCEEDPFARRDGKVDWVRWEDRPWYDYSGAVGGMIMFAEVITERRQAREALERQARELARSEEALRRQTDILQSVLNSMGDGVIVVDGQGVFTYQSGWSG
jgi:PAS domain-containing protein